MNCHLVHEDPDYLLLSLRGSLNAKGTGLVEDTLRKYAASNRKSLLLDLSDTDFLSSIGLRLLLQTAKTLGKKDLQLILIAPSPTVHSVLNASALDMLVPVAHDLDAARAMLDDS